MLLFQTLIGKATVIKMLLFQALTGKAAVDIEEEMGFPSTRAGGGVPVEVLRRLGHYLILEASGHLAPPEEAPSKAADPTPPPKISARKRGLSEVEHTQEVVVRYDKKNFGLGVERDRE